MWNDNPYYVLDAPWSSAEQREAAEAFLDFLLSEPVQQQSLEHGFRPGNPAVPVSASRGVRSSQLPALRPPAAIGRDLRGSALEVINEPARLLAARARALAERRA